MREQTYVSRREANISFARNRNTVRYTKRNLGPISQIILVGMTILAFGLIYVAEGTKVTSFDYEISAIESEISDLSAKRDDLAVEKARLVSITTAKTSVVASAMEDAKVTGYVSD